jgi:uncharacterized protein (DUF2141 family)
MTVSFLLLNLALAFYAHASEPPTVTIAGRITGASGHHSVYVALWSDQHFLDTPVQSIHLPPETDGRFRFTAAAGRWGVSAFEDVNENGRLDMGMFGPKEPNGFWREFRGHHKPHFEEIAVQVDHDLTDANIALR